jgi:hypothetical protein
MRGNGTVRRVRAGARAAAAALLLAASCGGDAPPQAAPPPSPAATRDGRWVQDIDYLMAELPRLHLNLFHRTPRAEFEGAADELRRAVPSRQDHELVVGLMRLLALAGDAHTTLGSWAGFHALPMELTRLADGLYVTAADQPRAALLGARVVAIGDRTTAELEAAAAEIVSHENQAWLRHQVPRLLAVPEVLHALGAAADPSGAVIWADDVSGARLRVEAPALPGRPAMVDVTSASGASVPLHRQRLGENYWFTVMEATRTLYLQYNRCAHGAERFDAFAERVFRALDQGAVDRLVVDVRHNGGGNSEVDDALMRGLQDRSPWRAPGRLFCLVGPGTFSSAVWTADDLRKLGAALVGSPTGGKPNSYGDTRSFNLPNARIPVTYSTKQFRLFDDSDPPSLAPVLAVEPTIADLRAGRDAVLEAAVAFRSR